MTSPPPKHPEPYVTDAIEGEATPTEAKALEHFQPKPARRKRLTATRQWISPNRWQIEITGPENQQAWYQVVGSLTDGRLYEDKPRAYRSSPLPAVRRLDGHSEPSPAEEKLLEKLYDTAVDGWRTLTDVRFKLLGLLPALSVIAWAALLREDGLRFGAGPIGGLIVGGAGLVVSIGIWIYDKRNNELYDDLISRARRIELEMGVDTGVFRGRLEPTRSFISHGTSTRVVYGTVVVGWILVMAWFGAILVDWVDPNALEAPTG